MTAPKSQLADEQPLTGMLDPTCLRTKEKPQQEGRRGQSHLVSNLIPARGGRRGQ